MPSPLKPIEPEDSFSLNEPKISIQKSLYDPNIHDYYIHSSGVKVYVSRDRFSEKAGVCLGFEIGYLTGSKKFRGLAHLAEHLFIRGPQGKGTLLKLAVENGGQINAYTANTSTGFYFDIKEEAGREALSLLMDIFVNRVVDEEGVLRDLNALEEEYMGIANNPNDRAFYTICFMSNVDTPYYGFSGGNKELLGFPGIIIALRQFINTFYVPSLMKLSVYGSSRFAHSDIVNPILDRLAEGKKPTVDLGSTPPFELAEMKRLVRISGLDMPHLLQILILFRENLANTPTRPMPLLTKLLSTTEEGGLITELIQRGITVQINVGEHTAGPAYTYLNIQVELLPTDLHRHEEITFVVFEYLEFIRKNISKEIYEEVQNAEKILQEFEGDKEPLDVVKSIIMQSGNFSPDKVLVGPAEAVAFSAAEVEKVFKYLSADHAFVCLAANEKEKFDKTVPSFGIQYSSSPLVLSTQFSKPTSFKLTTCPLKATLFSELQSRLKEIIASKPKEKVTPTNITPSKYAKVAALHHEPLFAHLLPLFSATFVINFNGAIIEGAKGAALMAVYRQLLQQAMDVTIHRLKAVNVTLTVDLHRLNVTIKLKGVSPAADMAFNVMVKDLTKVYLTKIKEAEFKSAQQKAEKVAENGQYVSIPDYMDRVMTWVLLENECTIQDVRSSIGKLTLDDWKKFKDAIRDRLFVDALITGDVTAAKAQAYFVQCAEVLLQSSEVTPQLKELRPVSLKKAAAVVLPFPISAQNMSMVALFYHIGADKTAQAFSEILGVILTYHFFEDIRVKRQIGYNVYTQIQIERGNSYAGFVIQSSTTSSVDCLKEIFNFVAREAKRLQCACLTNFEKYQRGAKLKYLQKPPSFYKHHDDLQKQLSEGQRDFKRRQLMLQHIDTINVEKYTEMFVKHFVNTRQYVHVHMVSNDLFQSTQDKLVAEYGKTHKVYTSLSAFHDDRESSDDLWKLIVN